MKQSNEDRLKAQKEEVRKNREAFEALLPQLLDQNLAGKYALMHNQEIETIMNDFNDAVIMGNKIFNGKPFSVQPIAPEPINLGSYSYR